MKEYKRKYPLFSLCGLNCGLCPRYHTEGTSKCPGCGGSDFYLKHPTCAIITCNKKHDNVEFCFQCSSFPCEKYIEISPTDSFITYKNVIVDFEKAKNDLEDYMRVLEEKVEILNFFLKNYNDGRRKNFYCIGVNLLSLNALNYILDMTKKNIATQRINQRDKIKLIVSLFKEMAEKEGVELELRK